MNEANNQFELAASWHLPDLAIPSMSFDGVSPTLVGPNSFSALISNQSPVPIAPDVDVEVTAYVDEVPCDVMVITGGFAGGEQREVTTTACVPEISGLHNIAFVADTAQAVEETSEDNNSFDQSYVFCADTDRCDGADDDCDGETDEDFPDLGFPCDSDDVDECEYGVTVCDQTGLGTTCDEAPGGGELCNGADDDCDGEYDEDWPDVGLPCGGEALDPCGSGIWTCAETGTELECVYPPGAGGPELCDLLDNDCDGFTDEDFGELEAPCETVLPGCTIPGLFACADDGTLICSAEAAGFDESCNGEDDDCDGETDEAFLDLGASCVVGQGGCRGSGVMTCDDDGDAICDAVQLSSTLEACGDEEDNDCDGIVDNACACQPGTFMPCGTKVGVCEPGVAVCGQIGLMSNQCQGGVHPQPESCDNESDSDCDGSVNEGCPCTAGSTRPCDESSGACADGIQECVNGAWSTCISDTGYRAETCNGVDDDCDGWTDEGCPCVPGTEQLCTAPPSACAQMHRLCKQDTTWSTCFPIEGTEIPDCVPRGGGPPTPDATGDEPEVDAGGSDDEVLDIGPIDDAGVEVDTSDDTPPPKKSGCAGAGGSSAPPWWLVVAFALAAVSRRRLRLARR